MGRDNDSKLENKLTIFTVQPVNGFFKLVKKMLFRIVIF